MKHHENKIYQCVSDVKEKKIVKPRMNMNEYRVHENQNFNQKTSKNILIKDK